MNEAHGKVVALVDPRSPIAHDDLQGSMHIAFSQAVLDDM